MADTVKQVDELRIKCTLRNGAAQTTRTITVDSPKQYDETEAQRMIDFRNKLMTGSLSGVIQPASWRDDDENMTPYETAAVEFSTFTSTEITRDIDQYTPPEPVLTVTYEPTEETELKRFFNGSVTVTLTASEGFVNPSIKQVTGIKISEAATVNANSIGNNQFTLKYTVNEAPQPTTTWTEDTPATLATVTIEDADGTTAAADIVCPATPATQYSYQLYDL